MMSDLICILASVRFAYQPNLDLRNTSTLKGCGYELQQNPEKTERTTKHFSENVMSEVHALFLVLPQFLCFLVLTSKKHKSFFR
jgi:hypothetical protein